MGDLPVLFRLPLRVTLPAEFGGPFSHARQFGFLFLLLGVDPDAAQLRQLRRSADVGQRSGGGMSGGAATGSSGSSGMTGAPSSTNPQAGGGPGGLTTAPHQVPENGGAPNATAPGGNAR